MAAHNGHIEIVKRLLDAGAEVDLQSKFSGSAETAQEILRRGMSLQMLDGWTALILAAGKGHLEVVDALLRAGAGVQLQNKKGMTALMLATQKGHSNIVEPLLKAGAVVGPKKNEL